MIVAACVIPSSDVMEDLSVNKAYLLFIDTSRFREYSPTPNTLDDRDRQTIEWALEREDGQGAIMWHGEDSDPRDVIERLEQYEVDLPVVVERMIYLDAD